MEDLTQHEKILVIMFRHYKESGQAKFWRASDFQKEHYGLFIGYEATARMSELLKKYPSAFEVRTMDRFRELKFNFALAGQIFYKLPFELGRHLVKEKIIK